MSYNRTPQVNPKTAHSLQQSPPHLIHPSLDRSHSLPKTASRSIQPFCNSTLCGQADDRSAPLALMLTILIESDVLIIMSQGMTVHMALMWSHKIIANKKKMQAQTMHKHWTNKYIMQHKPLHITNNIHNISKTNHFAIFSISVMHSQLWVEDDYTSVTTVVQSIVAEQLWWVGSFVYA